MRITELRDVSLGLKFIPESKPPFYELSFTDKKSGDVTWVAIPEDVGRQLAEKFNGGIAVAKPKLVVPRG